MRVARWLEMAANTGLTGDILASLFAPYRGVSEHPPSRVFCDLAVAVADYANAISGIGVLVDRQGLFGLVAWMPTCWRMSDRIDADHPDRRLAGRAALAEPMLADKAAPTSPSTASWCSTRRLAGCPSTSNHDLAMWTVRGCWPVRTRPRSPN